MPGVVRCRRDAERRAVHRITGMARFFNPNIDRTGRIVRVVWGVLALAGGLFAWNWRWWAGAILIAVALFAFFEALRGWCLLRA